MLVFELGIVDVVIDYGRVGLDLGPVVMSTAHPGHHFFSDPLWVCDHLQHAVLLLVHFGVSAVQVVHLVVEALRKLPEEILISLLHPIR